MCMEPQTHGKQLLALGWRSGSVVPSELYEAVRPHLRHGDEPALERIDLEVWLIVVSQTCDVVAISDKAEPYFELLLASPYGGRPRAQYRDLNSTRRLDFRPNREIFPEIVLTAHATVDRYFVRRELFTHARPHPKRRISAVAEKKLRYWFSLRSSRPAWPNALVSRLKPAEDQLEAALGELRDEIAEVRVAIAPNDRELGAHTPYRLAVFFVVPEEVFRVSPEKRGVVQQGFNDFVRVIRSCAGVEFNTDLSDVVSGDEFTWEQTRSSDLWDFAYLSQAD